MKRTITVRPISGNWWQELTNALKADRGELRIIAPFIKENAIRQLLSLKPKKVRAITRFNLDDCADGASDLGALEALLAAGAQIRGIIRLHSKVYLFGQSRAIVTSANLTQSALESNHEFGLAAEDAMTVGACGEYFEELWRLAKRDLTKWQLRERKEILVRNLNSKVPSRQRPSLGDFGVDVPLAGHPSPAIAITTPTPERAVRAKTSAKATAKATPRAQQAFVKFLGQGHERWSQDTSIRCSVEGAGCHWALCYSAGRGRPRAAQDGDVMFIGRLTKDPDDIMVFGKAVAIKHHDKLDNASRREIKDRGWKEHWSRYIRVHSAEFVAGTLENGVSLYDLMKKRGPNLFATTQIRARRGERDIDMRRSYARQAQVKLSEDGCGWLNEKLEAAFIEHGTFAELCKLDWPDLPYAKHGGGKPKRRG